MGVLMYVFGFGLGLLLARRPDYVVPLVRFVAVLTPVSILVYIGKRFIDWLFRGDY